MLLSARALSVLSLSVSSSPCKKTYRFIAEPVSHPAIVRRSNFAKRDQICTQATIRTSLFPTPTPLKWFATAASKRDGPSSPVRRRRRTERFAPPIADRRPHEILLHNDKRVDPYYYMRNKNDPLVLDYLDAENDYADSVMKHTEPLQKKLYREILSHVDEEDVDVPERYKGFLYYSKYEKGKEYELFCRRKDEPNSPEEVLLDVNELAGEASFFDVGLLEISPDQKILAYGVDRNGEEKFDLYFKDLSTGKNFAEIIPNVSWCPQEGGVVWSNDSQHVFYVTLDATGRPHSLWRHKLGIASSDDTHVYHESDPTFRIGLEKSKTEKYIFLFAGSGNSSEIHYLDAEEPHGEFKVIHRRQPGLEYSVEHHLNSLAENVFYIHHNDDEAFNFKISKVECKDPKREKWKDVIAHRPETRISAMDVFADYLVTYERANGLPQIRVAPIQKPDSGYYVPFNDSVYSLHLGRNSDLRSFCASNTNHLLLRRVYDLEMDTRELRLRKQSNRHSSVDRSRFRVERLFATADDGVRIPISLVSRKERGDKIKPKPCILTGYGAYGMSNDAEFDEGRLPLLERGFVYAIAHVRGGGEFGHQWKENGKLLKKLNTFTDFLAVAKFLIANKYTDSSKLAITGNSAGGLMIGAAVTMAPHLFRAVVMHVPFVDIITTMMDASIPLTTIEWDEWGNPLKDEQVYRYMKSYSPYDNVLSAHLYPSMLIFAGLNDPRVAYWEPAKWVAKIRAAQKQLHSSSSNVASASSSSSSPSKEANNTASSAPSVTASSNNNNHNTNTTTTNSQSHSHSNQSHANVILLRTAMGAGHNGPSGRYSELREEALELAFILSQLGMKE